MQDRAAREPCSLLVRGGLVIPATYDPDSIIEDGAVCSRGDRIVAVGSYARLRRAYAPEVVCGSDAHVLMPGLVNAHDHVRAPSTAQLGLPDDVLEAWMLDLLRLPELDPRLASTLACCRLLQSGVTTVLNSFYEASVERYGDILADTVAGCERSGIRSVVSLGILDRSPVSELLDRLQPRLPPPMQAWVRAFLSGRKPVSASNFFDIVRDWHGARRFRRTSVMMGPVSVHWCSDTLLQAIWEQARSLDLPIQTHLLESRYQRDAAAARYRRSVLKHMSEGGLLSPRLSCAHCVHVTGSDMELLADAGVSVIHCAGSNLRLKNGTAPVAEMLEAGINVGLGLDSLAIGDDGDMLREMRLVSRMHGGEERRPVPFRAAQVLNMATVDGARALGMLDDIGTLEIGKKADILALKMPEISSVRATSGATSGATTLTVSAILDRLVESIDKSEVDTVIVDGERVIDGGRHRQVDEQALLEEIDELLAARSRRRSESDAMIAALKPYVHDLLRGPTKGGADG